MRRNNNRRNSLNLWNGLRSSRRKDADSGIAEVEDGRKRLAGLK
jgi:hypothetical protein